jgi:hypothetical protein
MLLHLKTIAARLVSSTRFGATTTPSSGTSFFEFASKHADGAWQELVRLLTSLKTEVPDDGVEATPKRDELTNLTTTVSKCIRSWRF